MEYPWHASAWRNLSQLRRDERLPHALLLDGERAVGKRALAARLVAACLCNAPIKDDACGNCRACKLLAVGSHPDRIEVTFELNREGKPRRELVVDQVRALSQRLSMTSQLGGLQMALIDPADALNAAAANALLKTLEEPAKDTMLILLADASWRLPATIRSRCQRVTLLLPPRTQAASWLAGQGLDADTVVTALNAAAGNPGLALELFRDGALPRYAEVAADLAALLTGRSDVHALASRWAADEPAQRLWFAAGELHRHSIRAATSGSTAGLDGQAQAFARLNRTRELLRGPLRPEWAVFDVLLSLTPATDVR